MLKIRIKKNKINKLVFEKVQTPKKSVKDSYVFSTLKLFEDEEPFVTDTSTYEETCKKLFKAECAKTHLNIDLIIPSSFDNISPGLRKAPLDLKACMLNLSATEMETFKNTDNMMPDPIDTFNASEDFAVSAFSNLPEKMAITPDKNKKDGKEETSEGVELVSLGLDYSHINEAEIGAVAGEIAGKVAAGGLKATGQVLGGIAAGAAPAMAGATAAGMIAGANTDAVPSSHIDDSRFENRKDKVKTKLNGSEGAKYKGSNAIEAIAIYVADVAEAVAQLAAQLGASDDAVRNFKKEVGLLIKHNDEKAVQYLSSDSLTKEIKGDQDEKDKTNLRNINAVRQILKKLLQGMAMGGLTGDKIESVSDQIDKIKNMDDATKARNALIAAIKASGTGDKDAAEKFINNISFSEIVGVKIRESQTYGYHHHLNEDDENSEEVDDSEDDAAANALDDNGSESSSSESSENKKETAREKIDAEKEIYEKSLAKLQDLCKDLVPKNGKEFPGYADAKARMDNLALEANKSITEKIDEICKVGLGDSDVASKVSKFLSNHPLNAKGLKEVWSRYYEELNHRRDMRLKAMQDISHTTHVQGWTCNIITSVVPRTIAKMLTYRYVLKLLKDKRIYSYTPLQLKREEALWNEQKNELMDQKTSLVGCIWVLNNSKLNSEDKSVMSFDNNKFNITGELPYIGLYLSQLQNAGRLNTLDDLVKSFASKNANEFILKMYENYVAIGYGRTLASSLTNAVKKMSRTFDVSLKSEYGHAYDTITRLTLPADVSVLAATMKFVGMYANTPDDISTLKNVCDTSIKALIANKDFDAVNAILSSAPFDGSIGECLQNLNLAAATALTNAMQNGSNDVYLKLTAIRQAILDAGDSTGSGNGPDFSFLNTTPMTPETLQNLTTVMEVIASGFMNNAAKQIMAEKKVQLQLSSLYNAYHDAFYIARPLTKNIVELYEADSSLKTVIILRTVDNLVSSQNALKNIKTALSKITVEPNKLFDKSNTNPYKKVITFAALVDGSAFNGRNPDHQKNITEDDNAAQYITELIASAGSALNTIITKFGANDGIKFKKVWPTLHTVALNTKQLLDGLTAATKSGKINGTYTAEITKAQNTILTLVNALNTSVDPTNKLDIMEILATEENCDKIATNKEIVPFLSNIANLVNSPNWLQLTSIISKLI